MLKSIMTMNESHQNYIIPELLSSESGEYEVNGDLQGIIKFQYSILYQEFDKEQLANSLAIYSGFLIFNGKMGEKEGKFAMQEEGAFEMRGRTNKITIIKHSGTGDFINITGHGESDYNGDGIDLFLEIN